jgi:hypothetical protein
MRFVPVAVGSTDAVHIYSDAASIWLQLRRDVPTEQSIAKPSFKTALMLSREQAIAIAGELLTAATRKNPQANGATKQTPTSKSQSPKPTLK